MSKDRLAEVHKRFLEDTAEHGIEVKREDGLYRHVRFRRPESWAYGFDLTTWPGMLCYSGDMGCYVFSRIPDMFEFFRQPGRFGLAGSICVNPGYWSEKVEAADRGCGIEEYSPDAFRERIARWLSDMEDEGDAVDPELRAAIESDVLSRADDGEHEAMRAAYEFAHGDFRFDDFYEVNVREYTHRFLWACHAIVWGIARYDEHKSGAMTATA